MKDWTIRRRIWASFAVILALMMVMATVAYTRLARIEQLTTGIETEILPRLNVSNQIMVERMANYSLTQEYELEPDVSMAKFTKALKEFNDKVYHSPQDEMQPDWDFSGFVVLARFTLDVARDVANADRLPTWNPGDEFHGAREKRGVK